jgi:hypothetical protein
MSEPTTEKAESGTQGPERPGYDVLAALDLDHKQFADRGEASLFGDAANEIRRLRAEVTHWKDHAREAGEGFGQVCKDYARTAGRVTELRRRLEVLGDKYAERARWVGFEPARREAWAEIRDDLRALLDGGGSRAE